MYKDKGGKWMMGPMWDFDAGSDFDWGKWCIRDTPYFTSYQELVLGTDPANHTGYGVCPNSLPICSEAGSLSPNTRLHGRRWKDKIMTDHWSLTDKYISAATDAMARNYTLATADRQKIWYGDYEMKKWLTNRVGYLDKVINNHPSGSK